MRLRPTSFVVAATLLASATPSSAQTPAAPPPQPAGASAAAAKPKPIRDELSPEGKKAWDAALELFNAKDYARAVVEFQRAYDLSKNPRILYNIAVCERQQLHYARAVDVFQRELAEANGKVPQREIDDIKATIDVLKAFVTTLDLQVDEPGAAVAIDDLDAGTTPLAKPLAVDVGKHAIKIHKDGFKEAVVEIEIHQGDGPQKKSVHLEPVKATVLADVSATGAPAASIWIDGTDMGPAPFKGRLEIGRHTIQARAPGFVTATQTSDIAAGQPLALTLTLAPERHEGKVKVVTHPVGAVIEVDQKVVGSSSWEGVLPTGGHQLRVSKSGYGDFTTEVTLRDDQVRTVDARLSEDKSRGIAYWATGAVVVLAATIVTAVVVFKPKDPEPVVGNLDPGIVPGRFHFH